MADLASQQPGADDWAELPLPSSVASTRWVLGYALSEPDPHIVVLVDCVRHLAELIRGRRRKAVAQQLLLMRQYIDRKALRRNR